MNHAMRRLVSHSSLQTAVFDKMVMKPCPRASNQITRPAFDSVEILRCMISSDKAFVICEIPCWLPNADCSQFPNVEYDGSARVHGHDQRSDIIESRVRSISRELDSYGAK